MTKYNTKDGINTLEAGDDPATANWGSKWRSPSIDEIKELLDKTNCNCTWVTKQDANGADVTGYTVTSKINGNSIFLPAAGNRYNTALNQAGNYGYYWSSSLYASSLDSAYYSRIDSDGHGSGHGFRSVGRSVRAVTAK